MKPDLYDPIEEDVKAGLKCIAYQITDLTLRMAQDAGLPLSELRADGGPTANKYLMQFQSDIAQVTVSVSDVAELSGFGAACAAGFSCGLYDPETIFANTHRSCFTPEMDNTEREARYNGWQKAVRQALTHQSLLNFKTHIRKAKPRMCVFSLFLHLAVDNARGFVIDWR